MGPSTQSGIKRKFGVFSYKQLFCFGPKIWCPKFAVVNTHLNILSCLDPRSTEAQEPAVCTARSRLQLALHARRDPLRDEIREVGRGLSLADFFFLPFNCSYRNKNENDRRAAMCVFTQDDGYVRGVAPTHDCSFGSFSNLCNVWRLRPVLELSP